MLAAIMNGKAAKVELNGKKTSWSELFREREDLLTAAIFGRLQYFSDAAQEKLLHLFIESEAPSLGNIHEILFWPSFTPAQGDLGMRVEPDIIIECEKGIIIIEVKPEWASQCEQQWERQVKAVLEHYTKNKALLNSVHYVALGGCNNLDCKKYMKNLNIGVLGHQIKWQDFLMNILNMQNLNDKGDIAIRNDLINALSLFGVHRPIAQLKDYLTLATKVSDSNLSLIKKMPNGLQKICGENI